MSHIRKSIQFYKKVSKKLFGYYKVSIKNIYHSLELLVIYKATDSLFKNISFSTNGWDGGA